MKKTDIWGFIILSFVILVSIRNTREHKELQYILEPCQIEETKDQPFPGVEGESQLTDDTT